MADDIVAIGGTRPGADERFEALFRSEYQNRASVPGTTDRQVQRAFLRLWRRRWLLRDTPGQQAAAPGAVDVDRAWQEFQQLRSRARRRLVVTAASGVALILIAGGVLVLTGGPQSPPSLPAPPRILRLPPVNNAAVTARIPLGDVYLLAAADRWVWAVTESRWLVKIDPRTNTIGRRIHLAWQPGSVAAGAGMVWLSTPFGRQRGQVQRIDAATGRPVGVLHLPAGSCAELAYGAGSLWASCQVGHAIGFLRIDPATGRVAWRSAPLRWQYQYGPALDGMTVAPAGLWYANGSGVAGFVAPGPRFVTVRPPPYTVNLRSVASLQYSAGFVWAMASDDGSVAKIDPKTGRIVRIYSRYLAPASSMAVAQGSLWLLDNQDFAYPSVLQVSIATGRPIGRLGGRRLCSDRQCWQVVATPGAIWVPGTRWLARIDPGRLLRYWHPE